MEAPNATASEKKHILIVDDEPIMLRSIKSWLDGTYKVSLVNSAKTAQAFLERHAIHLMLLDYEMPVMSGKELFLWLRSQERTRRLPVIFLTGKTDRESVGEITRLAPDGYLPKHSPPEEIKRAVQDFFASQGEQSV